MSRTMSDTKKTPKPTTGTWGGPRLNSVRLIKDDMVIRISVLQTKIE